MNATQKLNVAQILNDIKEREKQRATGMPTDHAALVVMFEAVQRLKELGWKDAIYCPKDGSVFEVIEAGSAGIHKCHYEGEWPTGSWWIHSDSDLWPARPILFRPVHTESNAELFANLLEKHQKEMADKYDVCPQGDKCGCWGDAPAVRADCIKSQKLGT